MRTSRLKEIDIENVLERCPVVIETPVAWGQIDAFRHLNNTTYFRSLRVRVSRISRSWIFCFYGNYRSGNDSVFDKLPVSKVDRRANAATRPSPDVPTEFSSRVVELRFPLQRPHSSHGPPSCWKTFSEGQPQPRRSLAATFSCHLNRPRLFITQSTATRSSS
jgi:hypothetical protein